MEIETGTFVLEQRTSESGNSLRVQRFAIVGTYSKQPPFVGHAALLRKEETLNGPSTVSVHHMGPPIENLAQVSCHLIGQINLTNEEIESIENWLADVDTQYCDWKLLPFQQYIIKPHMKWEKSEKGRPIRQRFSCVGYVIEAYKAAGIELLETANLPGANKLLLMQAYSEFSEILNKPRLANNLGVPGNGPWKVALAGYLFHSTGRYSSSMSRKDGFIPTGVKEVNFPSNEAQPDLAE